LIGGSAVAPAGRMLPVRSHASEGVIAA